MKTEILTHETWNRPAQQDRSSRTEQRILEASERLMDLRPFHEITIAEIAQEASASVSSLYARFPSKEALLGAVFHRFAAAQWQMFDEVLSLDRWADVPLSETLKHAFPLLVEGYRQRQGLVRAFLEEASRDVRFRETWDNIDEKIIQRVTEIVMQRIDDVSHPEPRRGVELSLEVVFATLAHRIQMHKIDDPDMDELVRMLIVIQLRYLGIDQTNKR